MALMCVPAATRFSIHPSRGSSTAGDVQSGGLLLSSEALSSSVAEVSSHRNMRNSDLLPPTSMNVHRWLSFHQRPMHRRSSGAAGPSACHHERLDEELPEVTCPPSTRGHEGPGTNRSFSSLSPSLLMRCRCHTTRQECWESHPICNWYQNRIHQTDSGRVWGKSYTLEVHPHCLH